LFLDDVSRKKNLEFSKGVFTISLTKTTLTNYNQLQLCCFPSFYRCY
jgi:hypothetical protein